MKKNENKELSWRGAAGDVAIPRDKTSSSRGRAESSDVVISCDKVLMNIRNNYCMSHLFNEIATSAFRLLAMTIPVFAFIFTLIATAASWAACDNGNPYGYMKDGTCVSCPSMPGTCHWDEEQGKAIMDTCDSEYGFILCGGSCKHPPSEATSAHCDEATGNLVVNA